MSVPLRKTRAIIDLDAVAHNVNLLWDRAGREKQYLVLLKANAYGHGSVAIARLAEELGVALGGIAALEEAEYLRRRGVHLPLLLLEDLFDDEIVPALEWELRCTVSTLDYARRIDAAAAKLGCTARLHVNVDSGMGRLGIQEDRAYDAILRIASLEHVQIEGLYTHFPSSDEADKGFSFDQIARFTALAERLRQAGIQPRYLHCANSGAVLDFPERSGFDLIRPGVASLGIFPSDEVDHRLPLRPALRLQSALVKVDDFAAGKSIGYGRTFVTPRPSRIGVVPIGYGDGFVRAYGSGGAHLLVHGCRIPVVGRVSMDMITVDLTDVPETVAAGDEAVIIGTQTWQRRSATIRAEDLARQGNTISYEVTCLLDKRIPRVYTRGGTEVGVERLGG